MVALHAISCVIYAAKSTADKRGSIPTQFADCRARAEREGWEVAGEFSDEGFSAYSGNRGPELKAAQQLAAEVAAERGACIFLVQHSDRIARGGGDAPGAPNHLAEVMFSARRQGFELRSVQDDASLTNPLLAFVMGERNFEDSKRKGAAVKAGMRRRAERGRLAGGPRPYGYQWEGERGDKRLIVVETERPVVVRIFEGYVGGTSQMGTARALNLDAIPTTQGGQWGQASVRAILVNVLYKGQVRNAGDIFEGEHEAIVSAELWNGAAKVREDGARTAGHGGGRPPKGSHLFTKGLLRCGTCERALLPVTKPNRSGGMYEVYVCSGTLASVVDRCPQRPIPRTWIDEPVLREFERRHLDLDATRERVAERIDADLATAAEQAKQAEAAVQRTRGELARVERDYLADELGAASYERLNERLASELQAGEAQAAQASQQEIKLRDTPSLVDAEAETLRLVAELRRTIIEGEIGGSPTVPALRRILHHLFETVVYRPKDADATIMAIEDYDASTLSTPGGAYIEPYLHPRVIRGYDENLKAIASRVALPLETDGIGFTR